MTSLYEIDGRFSVPVNEVTSKITDKAQRRRFYGDSRNKENRFGKRGGRGRRSKAYRAFSKDVNEYIREDFVEGMELYKYLYLYSDAPFVMEQKRLRIDAARKCGMQTVAEKNGCSVCRRIAAVLDGRIK